MPLLACVSLLPGWRAAVPGLTYYFRDFSLTYYPLRAFFATEVAQGRWPFWNSYIYEGCPFLPMFYPLELAQLLWPGPAFVSWLLTLHFPIAALAMYALARDLGTERRGAFAAGAAYSMGGLALSSLSLHWFLQALALAPLIALTLKRAAERGGRAVGLAACVLALAISTLAVEFVAQGFLLGLALGLTARADRTTGRRLLGATVLGVGLASLPIFLMLGIVGESLRGGGLGAQQLLDRALPPVALLQAIVPDLAGSLAEPQRFWWGGRIFPNGPYFMSIYLGPVVLILAGLGFGALPRRLRFCLAGMGLLGLWYALGSSFGLAGLVAPVLRFFRFPVKALLLPYLVLAIAFGFGVDRLAAARGARVLSFVAGGVALVGGLVAALGALGPTAIAVWLDISPTAEALMLATLQRQGFEAALLSLSVGVLGFSVSRGTLAASRAAALVVIVAIADLARAGAGINPQVSPAFFELATGVRAALHDRGDGRVFSYGIDRSPALASWSATRPAGVERWSFFLGRQLLDPFANLTDRIETSEGHDRLSFIPNPPALHPAEYDPGLVDRILPRLRNAAVNRLVSLDPLLSSELRLRARVPAGPGGLAVHVYDLASSSERTFIACRAVRAADRQDALRRPFAPGFDPLREVALEEDADAACQTGTVRREATPGRESYEVVLDGAGVLVMRDSYAPSWKGFVDGQPAPILRANGRHRAVALAAGTHTVTLQYDPPGLLAGIAGTLVAVCAAASIWVRGRGIVLAPLTNHSTESRAD